jgi:DNA-binding MarR family transcriptional regulator
MNEKAEIINHALLKYQSVRLQELIREMLECCEDRKLYESNRFNLPYAELKCLMLFDGERYLTVKGIAQKLDVAKSRVTKIVDGLIEKRLVERMDDPKDARIKLINLTSEGQNKSEEIASFQREIHQKILLQMDTEERKSMLSYLEVLRSAMEAVKERLK